MSLQIIIQLNDTNKTQYDVTDSVILSTLRIVERDDLAFECGSFKFLTSTIRRNIAPYSLCFINGKSYVCQSTATRYLTKSDTYMHEVVLYDANAILETYILGSKAYSNDVGEGMKTDYQKISMVVDYLTDKYPNTIITITADSSGSGDTAYNLLSNATHEYIFGAGSTLYYVLRTFASINNLRIQTTLSYNNNNVLKVDAKFYYYGTTTLVPIDIANSQILSFSGFQNMENYSKYLEFEADNVVDRTKEVYWTDLTPRSNGCAIDSDVAEIVLPTNVEGITLLEVNGAFSYTPEIKIPAIISANLIMDLNGSGDASGYHVTKTYQEFVDANISYGSITNVFQYFYNKLLYKCPDILTSNWTMSCDTYQTAASKHFTTNATFSNNATLDYTSKLAEQKEYKSYDVASQPTYAVYESGSNRIFNLNAKYRADFWNAILNYSRYNFLHYPVNYPRATITDDNYADLSYKATSEDPLQHKYNVKAVPVTAPIFIDSKNLIPVNEVSYKDMSRTYSQGNDNGMPINFFGIKNDIDKQNEQLGKIEGKLEIDVTDMGTKPYLGRPVYFDLGVISTTYTLYPVSIEKRFYIDREIWILNLASNRFKVADGIGVDYQFEPTKFPLNSVITRPISIKAINQTLRNTIKNGNRYNDVFIRVKFYDYDENEIATYIKRPAYYQELNLTTFYIECIDNYSFDKKAIYKSAGKYECRDMPYGDSYGQVYKVDISLLIMNDVITQAESYLLPSTTALIGLTYDTYTLVENRVVRKDPRERLTFTIEI